MRFLSGKEAYPVWVCFYGRQYLIAAYTRKRALEIIGKDVEMTRIKTLWATKEGFLL